MFTGFQVVDEEGGEWAIYILSGLVGKRVVEQLQGIDRVNEGCSWRVFVRASRRLTPLRGVSAVGYQPVG